MSSLLEYLNEYELLTNREKAYVANGCGPKFGPIGFVVPDFGGLYTSACNLHDWIYWSGGPAHIRLLADRKMRQQMNVINNGLSWWKRWGLYAIPTLYYNVIRSFGKAHFHYALFRKTRHDLEKEMRYASL